MADAAARVVLWGDYQERNTRRTDKILRGLIASRGDVMYTFRHYPISTGCNPTLKKPLDDPLACRAALAAEAAGFLGGNDAFWLMHEWLMERLQPFDDTDLHRTAAEIGLDADAFVTVLDTPDVAAAVADDTRAAGQLRNVPTIFINGLIT